MPERNNSFKLIDGLEDLLGQNDLGFLRRVYADGLEKYEKRLSAIGFINKERILDAGCGFGQWAFAMAKTSKFVAGVDISSARVEVCCRLAALNNVNNSVFMQAKLEKIPYPDDIFDAVFAYSVLCQTDYRVALKELCRVLKPGGLFYMSTNGPGKYLYDILHGPNPAADFNPRIYGLLTFCNTLLGKKKGFSIKTGAQVMTRKDTIRALTDAGFKIVAIGGEGTLFMNNRGQNGSSFFRAKYMGMDNVFEVIAKK
jgi:ubiquinone/menaquinone biosynthesis C-methylase UbiE